MNTALAAIDGLVRSVVAPSKTDLHGLRLGDLFVRARAVNHPDTALIDALNAVNPKQALIKLIEADNAPACKRSKPDDDVDVSQATTEASSELVKSVHVEASTISMQVEASTAESALALDVIWSCADASSASGAAKISSWLHATAQLELRLAGGDGLASPYVERARAKLRDALDEQGRQASERQAIRRSQAAVAADVLGVGQLERVVQQKLEAPSLPLTAEQSRSCLVSCIQYAVRALLYSFASSAMASVV